MVNLPFAGLVRHVEAMMGVFHHRGVPLFRLQQTASDRERVDKLTRARGFEQSGLAGVSSARQLAKNFTPCAFTALLLDLPAGRAASFTKLLGRTLVTYRNEQRLDTWGERGARPVRYAFTFRDGKRFVPVVVRCKRVDEAVALLQRSWADAVAAFEAGPDRCYLVLS